MKWVLIPHLVLFTAHDQERLQPILPDETPMEVKKQRLQILQNRLLLQASRYSQA